jgi:uncharacterized membrane protein YeaQ/YmgE (transglycosylase-associated protein family)
VGIISWILVGLIAGLLAKFLLPGDDPGGLILTTIIGLAGAQVSSSDFSQWDRNLNTAGTLANEGLTRVRVATQTVLHDANHPSRITMPVASG